MRNGADSMHDVDAAPLQTALRSGPPRGAASCAQLSQLAGAGQEPLRRGDVGFRGDAFLKQAPGLELLPSGPTLRQQLDAKAGAMFDHVPPMIETLLAGQRPDYRSIGEQLEINPAR